MKLNYILIPENITRRPRPGHRHKVSPISRADRRAPGEVKDKATPPVKSRAHWENVTSRIEAFLKGVNKYVAPQTNAAASTGQKDIFNTESFLSKVSRKSAFHRHLLNPDQEAPAVPSRPDTFYLPPSPKTPTALAAVRRATSDTQDINISISPLNFNTKLVPERNLADCVGKIQVKDTSPGLSSFLLDKAGSLGSARCSTALSNAHGNSWEDRNISIHRQPRFSPDVRKVHVNQYPPYQSITHPQFFDYNSRLQPPIQSFQNNSSTQEYTPLEPYFDHTFRQHTPVYWWFANQNIHSIYPHRAPLNWHSQYSGINRYSPLEYSPHQPYFSHY